MHHTNYEKLKQKLNEFLFPLPSFCKKKKKKEEEERITAKYYCYYCSSTTAYVKRFCFLNNISYFNQGICQNPSKPRTALEVQMPLNTVGTSHCNGPEVVDLESQWGWGGGGGGGGQIYIKHIYACKTLKKFLRKSLWPADYKWVSE